ncbi:MAG: hypothetical protein HYV28_00695 [Ignavibacteriales bacterium]|nr:hypothetical protein [Ignavibacteriales bacterium]
MGIDSLSLHTNPGLGILIIAFLALAAFSAYVYHYTIPEVPRGKRMLLTTLRMLALVLIVFVAAEPVITMVKKIVVQPRHLVFIDKSASVAAGAEGVKNLEMVRSFLNQGWTGQTEFYTFDDELQKTGKDSLQFIQWDGAASGFSQIFSSIRAMPESPATVTIISDGIATTGTDPAFAAEKAGIPVFSIVIGDSMKHRDVIVQHLETPEAMVAGTQYVLRAQVVLQGLNRVPLKIRLKEESNIIEEKTVVPESGFNSITFAYTPKTAGERKLTVEVDSTAAENNKYNNRYTKFANVKDSKVKVLLVAGSPSADFTFIRTALSLDTNLVVRTIVELGQNKVLVPYNEKLLDSCSMYYFIGFPSVTSSPQLFNQLLSRIRDNQKSFFILLDESYSQPMLDQLADYLPARVRRSAQGSLQVQPVLTAAGQRHPVLKNSAGDGGQLWSELPPVFRPNVDLLVKPEAEIMMTSRIGNSPLLLPLLTARAIGKQRSVLLTAADIWRWQLNTKNSTQLFSQFIQNNFRWIHAGGERERLTVSTSRKLYSKGEKVILHAELFDESYNLLSGEQIDLEIRSGGEVVKPVFAPIGSGLYEASLEPYKSGDYTYTAVYKEDGKKPLQKSGRFTISEQNLELVNLEADYNFLSYLSKVTGGKAYYNKFSGYQQEIEKITARAQRDKTESSEFVLRNNPFMAVIIVLLFAIEWFIRKRSGML